jgi:vanillate O-demethylase monooxygenase subunit
VDARCRAAAVLAQEHPDRFRDFDGRVDRWQIIHYYAPSTICIDVGVARAGTGAPEGDRSQGVNGYVMNTITPETERTSHYFWAFMRNYRLDSQLITTQLREGVRNVFAEDEAMLAAQQAAIDANPDHEFYSLNIDAGGMWVRRILDRMLEAEGRTGAGPVAEPVR